VAGDGSSSFDSSSVALKWLRWVPNLPATFLMVIMENEGWGRNERVDEDERNATKKEDEPLFNKPDCRNGPNNASRLIDGPSNFP